MADNNKILVTGATGFLGSYLVRYLLKQGHSVRAIKRSTSRIELLSDVSNQIEWVEGDILDIFSLEDALKDISVVYHCAAMVSFSEKDNEKMYQINIEGTANVVNACLEAGIKKLVHVSSIAAIGRTEKSNLINEAFVWQDDVHNSAYAISKYKAEQEVWRAVAEGLDAVIVNPSIILGAAYLKEGSSKFFERASNAGKYYPSGSSGFVDVRDVARAMILLMESKISNERFIINGENWTYQKLLNEIANATNNPAPSIKAKKWQVALLWRIEKIKSWLFKTNPLLTKSTALSSSLNCSYSNDKFMLQFPDFKAYPIKQTIVETAAAYKDKFTTQLPLI